MALIFLGAILLIVGIIGGITVGLNSKSTEKDIGKIETINKTETINNIDDFYNCEITKDYIDIRNLDKNYDKSQAQKDNCFVLGVMVHNEDRHIEFTNNYNEKKSAFIRVAQTTTEGDLFLIDILYNATQDKIYIVKDDTRDEFSALEDRTIKFKTYEKTGIWNYQNEKYWVVYNGELPDGTTAEYSIDPDNLFIIAMFP